MTDALIVVLLILAIFQTDQDRMFPALVFSVMCGIHLCFFSTLEGFWYCFSAGACDVLVIAVLAMFAKATRLTDTLISLSIVSLFLNMYGWVTWLAWLSPEPYNLTMTALYFIAILSILRKDCANDYARANKRHRGIRLFSAKCSAFFRPLSKEAGK